MSPTNPTEDITPRDTLPDIQLPASKSSTGWQTEPLPIAQQEIRCPHMGKITAALQAGRYPMGAEWVCPCGQVFVVAVNDGGKRTLRMQEAVVETPPAEQVKTVKDEKPTKAAPTAVGKK